MKQETNINDMKITRQKWVNEGGILYPISGNTVLLKTPRTRPRQGGQDLYQQTDERQRCHNHRRVVPQPAEGQQEENQRRPAGRQVRFGLYHNYYHPLKHPYPRDIHLSRYDRHNSQQRWLLPDERPLRRRC